MTSIDKTAPKLVSALPKKGVTAVPVTQDIVLTFNEAIKLGTGNIILSSSKGDIQTLSVATSSSATSQFSIIDKILTINPDKNLLPNSRYSIKIDNTAILDLSDNKYAGIKNTTTLYFDTVDTLAPTLIKTSPVINTSNVASNASMVLTLSEKIQSGTGSITLVSGYDSRTISLTDKQVKISGTTLLINPSVDFNVGSTYAVHIDAGAIKDLAPVNNSAAAIDFSLTTKATGDKQAPVLQSYLGKGSVSANLQLTFQETIKIGKGSFTLVNSADSKDKIIISTTDTTQVSIENNVLTINPKDNLKPETIYLLTAPKGIVTDLAKNVFAGIAAKVPFKFDTHDTTAPELKISGEKATATNGPIVYTFTPSEAITGFTVDDISVTGGTKGEFKSVTGTNNFTLSVTPDANSTKSLTVDVAAGKFTDIVGNTNVAALQNIQVVDTVLPTLIISGEKATATNSPILYTFTASEAINGFTVDDISVKGGTKEEFKAVTGTNNFTLSVTPDANSTTPVTVNVTAGKFTDIVGNTNIAALQNIQAVDTVLPTLMISSGNSTATNSPIIYTFTPSEAITGLTVDDIAVTGGTKGEFKAVTGTNNFTLSVTPDANSTKSITVDVAAGKFTDIVGNANLAALQTIQAVDTVLPTLMISSGNSTATNSPIIYTFTPSEAIKGFTVDDITVTGGTKGDFKAVTGTNNFTLSVTPDVNSAKPLTVDVASGKFTDIVGNTNVAALQNTQTVDTVAPTITITNNQSGVLKTGDVVYTFTLSEASSNFTLDDISVTGGTKATTLIALSSTVYTLSVTPDANSTTPIKVDVSAGKFSDVVGNNNLAAPQNTQDVDTVPPPAPQVDTIPPTITITDDKTGVANSAILYTFMASEVIVGFTVDDITVTGGSKVEFKAIAGTNNYTLSVTPAVNSTTPVTINVAAGKFTDVAGNNNLVATQSLQEVNTVPTLGKAIDGYLAGAAVTVGSYTTTTDPKGNFTLPAGIKGEVVVSGGTDLTTGQTFKGVLKGPEGSTNVTPLTTLQQAFITSGQTPAQAEASAVKLSGLPVGYKLDTDPIAALSNASPAEKATATAAMAGVAKMANFLVTAGEVLKGAGGSQVTSAAASDAIFKSLVNSATAPGSSGVIDLSNPTLVTSVLKESAKEVAKTVTGITSNFEAKITTMASTVANVIKDATDNITAAVAKGGTGDDLLASMGNVSKFTQTGVAAKLQDVATTLDPNSATALKDLSAVESSVTGDAADKGISSGLTEITTPVVTPPVVTTPDVTTPDVTTPTNNSLPDGIHKTISGAGTTNATNGTDVFTIAAGTYTHTINGFNSGDSINFFANAVLNIVNDTNQLDGIQELTATDPVTNTTVTLTLSGLTAAQDTGIYNIPSLNTVFANSQTPYTVNFNGLATSASDTFNIVSGTYNLTIAGFNSGDKLNIFSGAVLNLINDTNQTDGIQVFTATDSTNNTTATITLTGLTDNQDNTLFNINSFDTVFGANTLILNNAGSSNTSVYSITAGNSRTIAGFVSGNKLSFFSGAVLNVINDTNQTDNIQELTATDPVSGSVATITLTGLATGADDALYNIPSFNTVFGAGTIAI